MPCMRREFGTRKSASSFPLNCGFAHRGSGDLVIGKTAIHVTTAPGEALAGEDSERIEFIDIEQFLTENIHEWGKFEAVNHRSSLERLIKEYNAIVATHERTPGLEIER